MNQPVQNKFDDLEIVDIRITDAAALPPKYFFRQSVIDALYKEVRRDVLSHHLPTPAGCEPVMAQPVFRARDIRKALITKQNKLAMYVQLPSTRIFVAAVIVVLIVSIIAIVRSF